MCVRWGAIGRGRDAPIIQEGCHNCPAFAPHFETGLNILHLQVGRRDSWKFFLCKTRP